MGYACKKQEQVARRFRSLGRLRRARQNRPAQVGQEKGKLIQQRSQSQSSQRGSVIQDAARAHDVASRLPLKPVARNDPPQDSVKSGITDAHGVCSVSDEGGPAVQSSKPEPGISVHKGVYLYYDGRLDSGSVNIPRPLYVI